ncbi:hypothetical protein ES703_119432 [subsurface metagenome]
MCVVTSAVFPLAPSLILISAIAPTFTVIASLIPLTAGTATLSVAVIVGLSPAFTSVKGSINLSVLTVPTANVRSIDAGITGNVAFGLAVAVCVKSIVCNPS